MSALEELAALDIYLEAQCAPEKFSDGKEMTLRQRVESLVDRKVQRALDDGRLEAAEQAGKMFQRSLEAYMGLA